MEIHNKELYIINMKTFDYITREYVPSVDLNTLGSTFNTLEQGHKEAVKAASDLQVAVANLEMDASEDGFKQQLINEIQDTVDKNTVFGNSYGALDDLVMKTGDIMSDGRVTGRLRNHANKKEYDAKVDAMNIPDGMKEMYKEENPYYYQDGELDERTGKYLPGEVWKPTTNPVATVPITSIQEYARNIAAQQSGGYDNIYFLDKDGKATPDAEKSADGLLYKQVGTKYEKLTKEQLKQAYDVAIQSIPGAEDSLRQDYKYARYQYDKLVKQTSESDDDAAPYMKGFTDRDGNVYLYDQWLENQINGYVDVAAYNRVYTTTSFGTALQNKLAKDNEASAAANNNVVVSAGVDDTGASSDGFDTYIAGHAKTETNSYLDNVNAMKAAEAHAFSIFDKYKYNSGQNSIKNVIDDIIAKNENVNDIQGVISYLVGQLNLKDRYDINGNIIPNSDKLQLINALVGYNQASILREEFLKKAGNDADLLLFSEDVANDNFTNSNKYSKKIINQLNKLADVKSYFLRLSNDRASNVLEAYNITDITQLRDFGFDVNVKENGVCEIIIPNNRKNLIPRLLYSTGMDKWERISMQGLDDNGEKILISNNPINKLEKVYKNGVNKAADVEKDVGVRKGTRTIFGGDGESFGELYYRAYGAQLGMNDNAIRAKVKEINDRLDNYFAHPLYSAGIIKERDEFGNFTHSSEKAVEAQKLIAMMYTMSAETRNIKRTIAVPIGTEPGEAKGYYLSLIVPEEFASKHYKAGEHYMFFVAGATQESTQYDPSYNPTNLAENMIGNAISTSANVPVFGYHNNFGDTRLIYNGNGTYRPAFMGSENILGREDAINYTSIFYTLQQFKAQYLAGLFNTPYQLEQLNNSWHVMAENLANIVGDNPAYIYQMIYDYFKSPNL